MCARAAVFFSHGPVRDPSQKSGNAQQIESERYRKQRQELRVAISVPRLRSDRGDAHIACHGSKNIGDQFAFSLFTCSFPPIGLAESGPDSTSLPGS